MSDHRDIRLELTARDHATNRAGERKAAQRTTLWRVDHKGLSHPDALTCLGALGLDRHDLEEA